MKSLSWLELIEFEKFVTVQNCFPKIYWKIHNYTLVLYRQNQYVKLFLHKKITYCFCQKSRCVLHIIINECNRLKIN